MASLTRRQLGLSAAALAAGPLARPALAQSTRETISFAGVTFTEAGRGDRLRAWVDTFNKSQDKIEVTTFGLPFASFANTMFTQMGGGAGPDLIRFDQIDYYAAIAAKRVLPLDELESGYKWIATDKYMKVDGKRYAIIFESSNYVLLYDKALVKDAPANFDEFLAAAKKATEGTTYGYAYRASMAERPGFWQDVCNFVYGFGGRWSNGTELTLNDPKVIDGITAYKRMYDAGAIPKGADAATYRRMFWEGKLAMEIDNGGVAGIFKQQAPTLDLGAAPSPFPTRYQGLILAPLTVNANTKHKEAAFTFIRWALEPTQQRELQDILGAGNPATVVPRTEAELAAKPWLQVYDDQTPYSVPQLVEGFEVKTPEVQQIVLEQVLRVLQSGNDPKRAMDEAQRQAVARLRR